MGAPWQGPRSPCQSVVGQTLGTNYKLCPAIIEFPSILHPTRAKIQGFPVLVHFSQVAIMTNRETKQVILLLKVACPATESVQWKNVRKQHSHWGFLTLQQQRIIGLDLHTVFLTMMKTLAYGSTQISFL